MLILPIVQLIHGLFALVGQQHAATPRKAVLSADHSASFLEEDLVSSVARIGRDSFHAVGVHASKCSHFVVDKPLLRHVR